AAICTHDRPGDAADCLAALCAQDLAEVEVLVVDSASRPAASQALHQTVSTRPGVRLIRLERPGLAAARNAALKAAGAPWIAYLDDDAVPAPDWAMHAKRLTQEVPAVCSIIAGRVDPLFPADSVPRAGPRWRQLLSLLQDSGEGEQSGHVKVVGANVIFRCDALRSIGGFAEALGRKGNVLLSGEEKLAVELLTAAGFRAYYSERLRVGHKIPAGRLNRSWAAKRAYWDGITDQRIRRLLARPAGLLSVLKTAAAIPVLALLAPSRNPAQEYFIRLWYNIGTLAELAAGERIEPAGSSGRPSQGKRPWASAWERLTGFLRKLLRQSLREKIIPDEARLSLPA
ncbi:MAG TPA: glycosyltransferase, partial [Methylocella sp.]|nr:glycosyltransferase [Methylocella sp.]